MSIIKPKPKQERSQIRIQIDSQILSEITRYCEYAGFRKPDEFFEEAALHILTKDKEFKEWKESRIQLETVSLNHFEKPYGLAGTRRAAPLSGL